MQLSMNRDEFKKIVKEAIKEVMEEERMESFLRSLTPVSKEEMDDITTLYGKPSKEKAVSSGEEIEV